MQIIKHIAVKIGSFIKYITSPILFVFKKIGLFLYAVLLLVVRAITYLSQKIWQGIKIASLFIWRYALRYLYIGLKYMSISIYLFFKKILYYLYIGLKHIGLFLHICIKKLGHYLYVIFKYPVKYLWLGIKHLGIFFYRVLYWISFGISKLMIYLYQGIKYLLIKSWDLIIRFFRGILRFFILIQNVYKSLPDGVYRFISRLFNYMFLMIHFIFVVLPIFLIITIPKRLLYWFLRLLIFIVFSIWNATYRFLVFISPCFNRLFHYIKRFCLLIYDTLIRLFRYYYVVLLSPIIIFLFLILLIGSFFHCLFICFKLALYAIINQIYILKFEPLFIRPRYNPSYVLYQYMKKYGYYLKMQHYETSQLKATYTLTRLFVWQVLFRTLIFVVFFILLLPITLLGFIIRYISSLFESANDIANKSKSRIILNELKQQNYFYIESTVLNTRTVQLVNTNIEKHLETDYFKTKDNTLIIVVSLKGFKSSYEVPLTKSTVTTLFDMMDTLSSTLTKEMTAQFSLPTIDNPFYQVVYEKVFLNDTLTAHTFELRNYAYTSKLKVTIKHIESNHFIERVVGLKSMINTVLFPSDHVYQMLPNQNLKSRLDPRFNYTFIASDYIDQFGVLKNQDEKTFEVQCIINDSSVQISVKVKLSLTRKEIKSLLKELPTKITYNREQNKIEALMVSKYNQTYKPQTLINLQLINFLDPKTIHAPKRITLLQVLQVDEPVVCHKFKRMNNPVFIKDFIYLEVLNALKNDYHYFDLDEKLILDEKHSMFSKFKINKKYIYLPKQPNFKVVLIAYKSLEPHKITSSGLIKNNEKTRFEVTLYRNLFKRKKFIIELNIK